MRSIGYLVVENMLEKFPITVAGYERLNEELTRLKTIERPSIIQAIAEARAHGDLSENAEYASAKEKQGFIEGRIADLESKAARAEVVDTSRIISNKVVFGAKVKLLDVDTDKSLVYQLVSDYEADVNKNLISIASPLGSALIGRTQGEEVEVYTPKGVKYYSISEISFS